MSGYADDDQPFSDPTRTLLGKDEKKHDESSPMQLEEVSADLPATPMLFPAATPSSNNGNGGEDSLSEQQKLLSPSAAGSSTSSQNDYNSLSYEELKAKEQELNKRDAELRQREKEYEELEPARVKNFPPIPKCCPCQPCFHVNISEEIPASEQWKIFSLISLLFTYTMLLFVNFALSFGGLVVGINMSENDSPFIITTVMATIWLFLLPVLALSLWFMPLYTAYRKNSSLAFMWFLLVMLIQVLVWAVFALGAPGTSCGLIMGIELVKHNTVVGGLYIALGLGWIILSIWGAVSMVLVHRYYRTSGGTMDKAFGEAAKSASSNKYLREAVKNTVKSSLSASTTDKATSP